MPDLSSQSNNAFAEALARGFMPAPSPDETPEQPDDAPKGPDMTGWTEAEKTAYAAAALAAEEEERALAEEEEAHEGTAAQRAIEAERLRVERARKERERIKRESVEKAAREALRKQYGDGVIFFPSKGGMIAVRVPTEKETNAIAERVQSMPRAADKIATLRDYNRDLVVYPTKGKFDEIAKKYPAIWVELPAFVDDAISARDFTARPYD